ncbi:MAG: SMC-Scp complex subunit ScpB [Candidatus Micrarchaeota archaeon]
MEKEEKKLIEAALFISSRAMTIEEFRTLTGIGALGYLQTVVDELKKDYEDRAIEIIEIEGKYSMQVKNNYLQRVKQFAQDIEISKSALRTLAYISKNDGILKSLLVKRIGTKVYSDVHELVDAGFVKAHKAGRTKKLTLTEKFKKYFVQQKQPVDETQSTPETQQTE